MERERAKRFGRVYAVSDTTQTVVSRQRATAHFTELLRGALDSAGALVYTIDRSYRITLVNAEWDRFAHDHGGERITSDQVIGQNVLAAMHGPQRERVRAVCEAIFRGERERYSMEIDCSTPGDPRFFNLVITPLYAADHSIIGATFTSHDITSIKQLESDLAAKQHHLETMIAALQQRETRARKLQQIAETLNATHSLGTLLQLIVEAMADESGVQAAVVYMLAEDGQGFVPAAQVGLNVSASDPQAFDLDTSLAGQVRQHNRALLVRDANEAPQIIFPVLSRGTIQTVLAVPITGSEGVVGVLEAYAATRHVFDADRIALLKALADQGMAAIRIARTVERERRRARLMQMLNRISEHLASELDEQAIVPFVTEALVEQLKLTFARVWLFDEATDTLVLRSSAGLYTHTDGAYGRIKLGRLTVGRIAATRQPFITNDVPNEPGLGEAGWAVATGICSFAGYPLVARGQLLGVAGFFSRQPLDPELVAVLEPVAHQVALALERAKLYVAQVAARREAQSLARIATSRATQLAATLAAMDDGVWTCDHNGYLLTVNDAALTMFGLPATQRRPTTIDELPLLFSGDCADRESCFGLLAALEGQTVRRECLLQAIDTPNSALTVALTATPMRDAAGDVVGAVAVVRDITEQKANEQLRDDFLSMAAHELKTPVTAIKGYAQLALMRLRSKSDLTPLHRALQTIDEQAERIANLVTELVDMSRIRVGRLDLRIAPFDLVEVVRANVEQIQMRAKRHRLVLHAPPTLGVIGDSLRIEQVVQNLLDNAVKYSPEGGPIDVVIETVSGDVQVTVRDEGIGISQAKQTQVFDAWFQAHADTTGDFGGMGLGLNICKEVVERHGGRMWVDSVEGQGSVFGFSLPLTTPEDHENPC